MDCEHRYLKTVRDYGKNSKPSYRFCKKCGEIISWEKRKNNKRRKR